MYTTKQINGYNVLDYNNIFVIEDLIDTELCAAYIDLIDQIKMEKKIYSDTNNVECFCEILNDLYDKNFDDYYPFSTDDVKYEQFLENIKHAKILTNNVYGIKKKKIQELILQLDKITEKIKDIMKSVNIHISFEYNSGYILRKIYGETREHIDGLHYDKQFNIINKQFYNESKDKNMNNVIVRSISAVFTFNDDYEGGLFTFSSHNVQIKLKKGSVLLFPPYWTHRHSTTPLLNNTHRYTVTTWYGEDISNKLKYS